MKRISSAFCQALLVATSMARPALAPSQFRVPNGRLIAQLAREQR